MSDTIEPRPIRIFIVAGEPSGDMLGGRLMRALRAAAPDIVFAGIGGEQMREQGLSSLMPLRELSVMGLVEVLPRVPNLLRRLRETADAVTTFRPDAVVTIDSSGFNKRLAARLIARGEPASRIHYVAPMVWAWRPNRVHRMAALFDHLLCLFPFEPPWFEQAGLACSFVGHPVVEAIRGDGPGFRQRVGVAPEAPLLCILPGSRRGEVTRLLPIFGETAVRLHALDSRLRFLLPTVETVAPLVRRITADWNLPVTITTGERAKADAFAASDAALAASGTVALELALAGVPTVVGHRMQALTAWVARRMIRIPWVSLPNIVLQRLLVPELLQGNCRPDLLAGALRPLLFDSAARQAQREGLREVAHRVGIDGAPPSVRAATAVLSLARAHRESHSASPVTAGQSSRGVRRR